MPFFLPALSYTHKSRQLGLCGLSPAEFLAAGCPQLSTTFCLPGPGAGKSQVKGRGCVGARGSKCSHAPALQAWRPLKRSLARSRQGLLALHGTALLTTPGLLIEHLISTGSPLHWHGTGALR